MPTRSKIFASSENWKLWAGKCFSGQVALTFCSRPLITTNLFICGANVGEPLGPKRKWTTVVWGPIWRLVPPSRRIDKLICMTSCRKPGVEFTQHAPKHDWIIWGETNHFYLFVTVVCHLVASDWLFGQLGGLHIIRKIPRWWSAWAVSLVFFLSGFLPQPVWSLFFGFLRFFVADLLAIIIYSLYKLHEQGESGLLCWICRV